MSIAADSETLSLSTSNAVILSVGLCHFSTKTGAIDDRLLVKFDPNKQYSREVSQSTLDWWHKQPPEVSEEALGGELRLHEGLAFIAAWMGKYSNDLLWVRNNVFDLGNLGTLFEQYNIPKPWKHWKQQELYTIKYISERKGCKRFPKPESGVYHTALGDAEHLAKEVTYYHEFLGI